MAGIFEIEDLVSRKRALAAESEIYRQTLRLEVRNLQLYAAATRRKWQGLKTYAPILTAATMLAKAYIARKRRPGLLGRALWAWQMYQRFAPALRLFTQRQGPGARGMGVHHSGTSPRTTL